MRTRSWKFQPPRSTSSTLDVSAQSTCDVIFKACLFMWATFLDRSLNESKAHPSYSRNTRGVAMLANAGKATARAVYSRIFLTSPVRSYHEKVVEHYNNPKNVGSFDKNDPDVGTGLVGAPACGDVMKLQIKVDKTTGKIIDSRFKTFGCGSAIASSSVATEWIKGRGTDEALSITNSDIAKHLSLPPVKLHCSMLAEDAIKAAIKDYQTKNLNNSTTPTPSDVMN